MSNEIKMFCNREAFMMPFKQLLALFCLLGTLVSANSVLASAAMNLGMIDSSPSKMTKTFSPLLEYLNSKGIPAGKVVTAKNMEAMIKYFENGKVDFMFESPYGALTVMEKTGATPILIREKKGVKEYNAVLFVKEASPIKSLSDLKGKVVAFEDKNSTSSFMLPHTLLKEAGLETVESRKPSPNVVSYYFSKDDDNTLTQVTAGTKADAGGIKKGGVEGNPAFRMLLPESPYVPRHVVLVRKGAAADKLKAVLLDMKNDPAAKDVLSAIKTKTGFSEFQGDPAEVMNVNVRKAMGL